MCDRTGILCEGDGNLNDSKREIASLTNRRRLTGALGDAMKGADVFIGVSGPDCVTKDMVRSMAERAIREAEPDQQRARIPGTLSRRARRARNEDQLRNDVRGVGGDRFLRERARAPRGLHSALCVRQAGA